MIYTGIGMARSFISVSEHLKVTEQKLLFLKRCKQRQVFPTFIYNSINVIRLFPGKTTGAENHVRRLHLMSLNQHISQHYQSITNQKKSICEIKDKLFQTAQQDKFRSILSINECNRDHVKKHYKAKLQKKFDWLIHKYYPPRPISTPTTPQSPDE